MPYNRCGRSGLKFPALSLGLWHNFGDVDDFDNCRELVRKAFDLGITHFDLANNYGPPPGSAERTLGKILKKDLAAHRDEVLISTKAGFLMDPGPYGDGGSRKHLLASLDQSLERLGLKYVDIFYHHRPDPETPLEETMSALDHAVRSGRALYAAISNYPPDTTAQAAAMMRALGTPLLIHQARYSLFDRSIERGLLETLDRQGMGCIAFSPLAQGLLTDKYLRGIPEGSRASKAHGFLRPAHVTAEKLDRVARLNRLAIGRGQTLAQLAIAWVLRHPQMTSALIGASTVAQLDDGVGALSNCNFTDDELRQIDAVDFAPA